MSASLSDNPDTTTYATLCEDTGYDQLKLIKVKKNPMSVLYHNPQYLNLLDDVPQGCQSEYR